MPVAASTFDPSHADFQHALWAALKGSDQALEPWWADAEQGLAALQVYRNTVHKALADALAASFPTVLKVVGPEWMQEASVIFARSYPPGCAVLVDYGVTFPDWLSRFEPAKEMWYLSDLARLDRLWTESHLAADTPPLMDMDAGLLIEGFDRIGLQLIDSARLAWFDHSIPQLWQALRHSPSEGVLELEAVWQAVLIWRPSHEVKFMCLSPKAYAFLAACDAGKSFAIAATETSSVDDPIDQSIMFSELIASGVFANLPSLEIERDLL